MWQFLTDEFYSQSMVQLFQIVGIACGALAIYVAYKSVMDYSRRAGSPKTWIPVVFIIFANCVAALILVWLITGAVAFNGYICGVMVTLALLVAFALTVYADQNPMHD